MRMRRRLVELVLAIAGARDSVAGQSDRQERRSYFERLCGKLPSTEVSFVPTSAPYNMDTNDIQQPGASPQADVCSYALFLPETRTSSIDTSNLQAFCAEVLAYVDDLCVEPSTGKSYIWQREAFTLVPSEDGRSLAGQTAFGESVEDEWFIVYLLREITKKYKDLVAKIEDTDGQFLLIEAAEVLPAWLSPENADNRVSSFSRSVDNSDILPQFWIFQGQLHLIPLEQTSPAPAGSDASTGFISQDSALDLVRDASIPTHASKAISETVWQRIANLPADIKQQWHHTVAQLPIGVARILATDENLISRAVQAFYERDAIQLKVGLRSSSHCSYCITAG